MITYVLDTKNIGPSEPLEVVCFKDNDYAGDQVIRISTKVENVGAIFIASTIATTCHTMHHDIRYKYINEYVEVRVVKTVFVSVLIIAVTF